MRRLLQVWCVAALISATLGADPVKIYDDSKKYSYHGCYNETTDIADTTHDRALSNGINEVKPGQMTVPMCLSFCGDGGTEYSYAGLEYSRECWCAQTLSSLADKLDDNACNLPCAGNSSQACGAALKLSVYRVSTASTRTSSLTALLTLSGSLVAWLVM